ncbi:tyrosine-type recombinase/integrase [uncultured Maribacter sp.]|uniref:tyrosine-type recombinase/integrase n=1 Tax=uncultured Maribacter sp. TaxID=431308 RepID=UPI00262A9D41|nr:tyrosine-type recombinase/integrase [uncultured Maribacter sp.]
MENFTHYLQSKNYSSITAKEYNRQKELFTNWYNYEIIHVQKKDILNYLGYLKTSKKLEAISRNNALIPLRHYFDYLLQQNKVAVNPTTLIKLRGLKKRTLKHIYNLEELSQLADDYYLLFIQDYSDNHIPKNKRKASFLSRQRNYILLLFFIHQGLNTREILELQTSDIQLQKATIQIPKGKQRGKARTLPLHATQIGALMQYLNEIRPQLAKNEESNLLFLPVKQSVKPARTAKTALLKLAASLKKIDQNFSNLSQLRASVITYWIKTYGLRKAQYLAGHKSIVSTEEYVPNNIEDLAEDITKFNPF